MYRRVADGATVQLATRVPSSTYRAVKVAALEEDVSIQDWVRDALVAYIAKCQRERESA